MSRYSRHFSIPRRSSLDNMMPVNVCIYLTEHTEEVWKISAHSRARACARTHTHTHTHTHNIFWKHTHTHTHTHTLSRVRRCCPTTLSWYLHTRTRTYAFYMLTLPNIPTEWHFKMALTLKKKKKERQKRYASNNRWRRPQGIATQIEEIGRYWGDKRNKKITWQNVDKTEQMWLTQAKSTLAEQARFGRLSRAVVWWEWEPRKHLTAQWRRQKLSRHHSQPVTVE